MSRYYSSILNVLSPSFNNTYSLAFDGIDDYIETTKTTALTTASLSMWVKVTGNFAVNERQSLASNDDFNHGRDFIIADSPTTTNDAYIGMFAGGIIYGKTSASGGIPINDGNWHHLVWTYDGSAGTSASINMYVDGQNQYSNATYSSFWSYEIKFQYFGKPTSANTYFAGSMDEVAYFNSILSPSDVTAIYNSGVPNNLDDLTTPPTAWYRNGDNGTWKSPQWLIPNNINVANSRFSNYSFSYDGVDDFVSTGISTLTGTDFSISYWFKTTATLTNYTYYVPFSAVTNQQFVGAYLYYHPTTKLTFRSRNSSGTLVKGTVDLSDGNWHNIVVTYDSTSYALKMYVDGSIDYDETIYSYAVFNQPLLLGGRSSSLNLIDCSIDEASYFNSVLTPANVTSIYNSSVPTDISSLSPVGYWRSENSTFSTNWTVTDNGSGSNDGTSANMTVEDRLGDAPNSTSNAVSLNMDEADRVEDVPS